MTLETRDGKGNLRLPSESELAECSEAERERYTRYKAAFDRHETTGQLFATARATLAVFQAARDQAHAAVARLTPTGEKARIDAARAWIQSQKINAAQGRS
jgi:multidrug resistance efflux pump